jgi:cytochrome P450
VTETLSSPRPIFRHRHWDGVPGWYVTDYKLGRAILADPRFGTRPLRTPIDDGGFQEALSGPESAGDLLRIEPPDHTRVRQLQTGYFSVKRVSGHRSEIEEVVELCLDAMEAHGAPADYIELFAHPVPSMAVCDLLGVPREDRGRFEHPDKILVDYAGTTVAEKKQAMVEFYAFIREVIERKRAHPGDDLLSELVNGGQLNDDELAGTTFFLFAGGHHTTMTNLSLSALFLLSDRERWDRARADLSSIGRTVEELLRLLSPIGTITRTAKEDVELGDGTVITAGEAVTVYAVAPSGDPEKIGDLEEFDPAREPSGHLAFGWGRHMCLGQHLARLELQVALTGLMRRFPNLRLAEPAEAVRVRLLELPGRALQAGVERLLVAW